MHSRATDVMTSLCLHHHRHHHHHHHPLCLCNVRHHIHPSSSSSSNSSSSDAATVADGDCSKVACTKPTSFRIADILTPSSRHFSSSGGVTRNHVTSTNMTAAVTSSDDADAGGEKRAKVDDVTNSRERHQLMTSGIGALGRLEQMTYNSADDDHNDVIIRRHQRRHHHHYHHHRQG